MKRKEKTLLKPTEIIEMYPDSPINASDIGRMVRIGLIRGFFRKKFIEVDLDSYHELLRYRDNIIRTQLSNLS